MSGFSANCVGMLSEFGSCLGEDKGAKCEDIEKT